MNALDDYMETFLKKKQLNNTNNIYNINNNSFVNALDDK